jgi:hypothetical protein
MNMKVTFLALMFVVGVQLIDAQGAITNALQDARGKYETAATKIEKLAYSRYTNSLTAIMQKCKQDGNIEAYEALQKEMAFLGKFQTLPAPEQQAKLAATIPYYSNSITPIMKDEQAEMATLQRSYIEYLDGSIKSSLIADRLDDAKRAREERDTITALLTASPKGGNAEKPERDQAAKTGVTSKAPDAPAAALAYKGSRYLLQTSARSWADARAH